MPRFRSLSFFALLSLAACGSTTLTSTGPKQPSRGEHCEFQILTTAPGPGFVELGTIDVRPGTFWGGNVFTNLTDFKRTIEPLVCAAGGDAALASANGYGMYIQATVLKSVAPRRACPRRRTRLPVAASSTPSARGTACA
jgi:hypothetical protein